MEKRYILNEDDKNILGLAKQALTIGIEHLKKTGLREANIEIELITHIKNELKK